ncbi:recombination protein RecR [candidate division TM6 bacterium RIFCSPHIGHO2_12_FULL_36_22]|nr:MAG: recombination protein RecR [candidate division TM6 bacterium RIFCSPHIGHO2_12_FULL_36_22]
MHKLPPLKQMLKQLQQVPYLASKNLYRVAVHFLDMDDQALEQFCKSLADAKKNLEKCSICCAWKERQRVCLFCFDTKRDQSVVCVVEAWQDLLAIEKTGGYKGVYHVLGGSICPLDGIGPEQLSIELLVQRTKTDIKEIILALNQTPEGEATSAYIAQKLIGTVIISCLAQGLPVGASLEYMDRLTVYKAISERRPF